jgi:predicted nucleotidyltransferase
MNPDLHALAVVLNDWLEPAPTIPALFLFGSRVRGDHRPDSDVDVRIFINEWFPSETDVRWWTDQCATDFPALKARLPGKLEIHDRAENADYAILAGRKEPVLTVGRVVCVWTPPKEK